MERNTKLLIILFVVLVAGILGAGFYFPLQKTKQNNPVAAVPAAAVPDNLFGWKYPVVKFPVVGPSSQVAFSDIRDPGGIPQGLPVRLQIPYIGVDSAIEDALITPDGRMDVPAGSTNVAWFALGPHPGQEGSAVIGGHFGISNGVPFVFYNLDKLRVGDKVYVQDDKGGTLAFQVRSIKLFDRNADATTVFTSSDGLAHLNLITCEGIWNQVNGTYPQRRVVFTDSIPSEGAITVSPLLPATSIPTPVAIPATTPTPGPTPSTTPNPPPAGEPNPSPTPTESPTPGPTPAPTISLPAASNPTLLQTAKSLYATPLDGITTSVLIISIAFMAFKVIHG
jgi:LPXTG-site transpeptidase (sortase) family protein